MRRCGIAFCGTGRWVRTYHLPELEKRKDRFEIVGFHDLVPERAAELAAGGRRAYGSLEELTADPRVDTVVVATRPVETHFGNAMACLEAGRNVILEKPMTYSSVLCDELIARARERKAILTVNHNLRCSICLKALQEVIRQGHLGRTVAIDIDSPRSWYDEHDFSNYATHMTDQALALNRSPLKEVTAYFVHPDRPMNLCGYGEALLRFESPPVIRISIKPNPRRQVGSEAGGHPFFRFYACGTKDTFAVEDLGFLPDAEMFATDRFHFFDNQAPDFSRPEFVRTLEKGAYDFYYETWAEGKPPLVAPESARNVIRCIELMNESARLGRAVPAAGMLPRAEEARPW